MVRFLLDEIKAGVFVDLSRSDKQVFDCVHGLDKAVLILLRKSIQHL